MPMMAPYYPCHRKCGRTNLAPANVRKEGAGFDLPMATAILGAMGAVGNADGYMLVGELSLDGSLRPIRGALSIAVCAAKRGIQNLLVPIENASEAAVAEGVRVFGLRHLAEVVQFLKEPAAFQPTSAVLPENNSKESEAPDFSDVRGQTMRLRQNHAGETIRRYSAQVHLS